MGFTIKGLFLPSSNEAVTDPAPENTNPSGANLADRHKPNITKSIANCRYAFDNDTTIRGIILNNTITANNQFRIDCKDEQIKKYIEEKVEEWDLKNVFTQTLLKIQRDGPCFIEKAIIDGSYQIRFLAYDGDKFKFKVIRDPQSDEILGFKQKVKRAKEIKNWQSKKYDDLENDEEEDEFNYLPNQIIYPVLLEESGKAKSLIMAALEVIDRKWTLEGFMMSAAHKAGTMIGITVGNDEKSNRNVPKSFVNKLIDIFRKPIEKDVAVIPNGVNVDVIGNSQLPDLPTYLKYWRNEIFIALQTPESLFSTESSNRSTAEVQADDETGYKVFITFLRDTLKRYFEKELIDAELELTGKKKAIGTVKIMFDEEEEPTPLKDGSDTVQSTKENQVEEDTGVIPSSTETPVATEA